MGTIIIKNAVKRKPGYLYYVDKDGSICEAKLARNGRTTSKKKKKKKIKKIFKQTAARLRNSR
jgi:hypothetical protein